MMSVTILEHATSISMGIELSNLKHCDNEYAQLDARVIAQCLPELSSAVNVRGVAACSTNIACGTTDC